MIPAQLAGRLITISDLISGSACLVKAGRMAVVAGCDDSETIAAISAVLDEVLDRLKYASQLCDLDKEA